MQKNKWIWIVAAVIVVAAAGYFFTNGGSSIATLGNTSLRSLLASGSAQKCTFSNANSSGTIYVSAGRMRGDFAAKNADAASAAQSHMIITNSIAYVWIDNVAQGYRMPFEDMSSTSQAQNNQGIDADAKVATNCGAWSANDAPFTLPSDVTFNALGAAPAQQPAATTPSAAGGAGASATTGAAAQMTYAQQQCAACNKITDATGKAQCIASFDCPSN